MQGCIGPVLGFIGLFPSLISIVGAIWDQEALLVHIGPYGTRVGLYGAIWGWGRLVWSVWGWALWGHASWPCMGPYGPSMALYVPGTGLYVPRTGPYVLTL